MLNHIVLMGRMVRDPELRRTQSGVAVTSFTLACERDYANNGERETDFIPCVIWRAGAEFVQKYFRKGSMTVVSGRLQVRQYTDKDGFKRSITEIVADNVYFGESKRDRDEADYAKAEKAGKGEYQPAGAPVSVDTDDDGELPF